MTEELTRGTTVRVNGERPAAVVKDCRTVVIVEFDDNDRDLVSKSNLEVAPEVSVQATSHVTTTSTTVESNTKTTQRGEKSTGKELPCGHVGMSNIEHTASDWEIQCPKCSENFMKKEVKEHWD